MTRGLRNNNPGNIRYSPDNPWQGLASPPSDGTFCVFTSPTYGIRALAKLLNNYYAEGAQTVTDIINRFAPPSENDTGAYVANVAARLGVAPTDVLDFNTQLPDLIKGIVVQENGVNPYSDDTINQGIALA